MTNSTSKNLVLNLISSKDSYYSFSSINQELKKESKNIFNQKKWSKINVINTNNEFIILPSKIPEILKKINIDKTIGNSQSTEKKTKKLNKLNFTFYIKKNKENKIPPKPREAELYRLVQKITKNMENKTPPFNKEKPSFTK